MTGKLALENTLALELLLEHPPDVFIPDENLHPQVTLVREQKPLL